MKSIKSLIWSDTATPDKLDMATPSLVSPANNADLVSATYQFTMVCGAVAGATSYRFQVAQILDTGYTNILSDSASTTVTDVSDVLSQDSFRWRVMAKRSGHKSAWSASRTVNLLSNIPVVPSIVSGDGIIHSLPRTITFSLVVCDYYRFQLSDDEDFINLIINETTVGNSRVIEDGDGVEPMGYYYIRVRSEISSNVSAWSEVKNLEYI